MPGLEQEEVMSKRDLKALLLSAKIKPVACAFGITKDRSAVILLSKLHSPKMTDAVLKKQTDITTSRYGYVSIDAMNSITFTVNRVVPPGVNRELHIALKGTGFMKVECVVNEGED